MRESLIPENNGLFGGNSGLFRDQEVADSNPVAPTHLEVLISKGHAERPPQSAVGPSRSRNSTASAEQLVRGPRESTRAFCLSSTHAPEPIPSAVNPIITIRLCRTRIPVPFQSDELQGFFPRRHSPRLNVLDCQIACQVLDLNQASMPPTQGKCERSSPPPR